MIVAKVGVHFGDIEEVLQARTSKCLPCVIVICHAVAIQHQDVAHLWVTVNPSIEVIATFTAFTIVKVPRRAACGVGSDVVVGGSAPGQIHRM